MITKNENINKQLQILTSSILQEKNKINHETNKIEQWQRSIEDIENYKAQGTIIRSKERAIVNEEKPTKYFYQQERQNQAKKTNKITPKRKKLNTTNLEILKECQKFDQKLYNKQNSGIQTQKVTKKLLKPYHEIIKTISKSVQTNQNEKLIKPINKNELKEAINQMENDKSPGIDGIPIEFFKTFYSKIEKDLLHLYNKILFIEKPTTQ